MSAALYEMALEEKRLRAMLEPYDVDTLLRLSKAPAIDPSVLRMVVTILAEREGK